MRSDIHTPPNHRNMDRKLFIKSERSTAVDMTRLALVREFIGWATNDVNTHKLFTHLQSHTRFTQSQCAVPAPVPRARYTGNVLGRVDGLQSAA